MHLKPPGQPAENDQACSSYDGLGHNHSRPLVHKPSSSQSKCLESTNLFSMKALGSFESERANPVSDNNAREWQEMCRIDSVGPEVARGFFSRTLIVSNSSMRRLKEMNNLVR